MPAETITIDDPVPIHKAVTTALRQDRTVAVLSGVKCIVGIEPTLDAWMWTNYFQLYGDFGAHDIH